MPFGLHHIFRAMSRPAQGIDRTAMSVFGVSFVRARGNVARSLIAADMLESRRLNSFVLGIGSSIGACRKFRDGLSILGNRGEELDSMSRENPSVCIKERPVVLDSVPPLGFFL